MNSPPATRPVTQEAAGAGPRGKGTPRKLSSHVLVINAPWNGSGYIKRKKAEFYVKEGHAIFVGSARHPHRDEMIDQLRLIESHPDNVRAAKTAAFGYMAIRRTVSARRTRSYSDGAAPDRLYRPLRAGKSPRSRAKRPRHREQQE